MILFEYTYEREGNDSWLIDKVEIHSDSMGLTLVHKYKWSGWNGEDKGSNLIELDEYDVDAAQERINKFLEDHSFYHKWPNGYEEGIKEINLREILANKKDKWN